MKKIRNAILALFCISALALAQRVVCQYDRSLDFSQFHTYKWVTVGSSSGISQATAENIVSLVNAQLAQKRLAPVAGDRVPDLYVAYQTSVAPQQQELNWFNSGGDWKASFGQASTETIETGTLVIDFYDPAQKQLVWRGTATNSLDPSANTDKNYNNLQKAITKLLRPFPPEQRRTGDKRATALAK
jgi:hypothetical protein